MPRAALGVAAPVNVSVLYQFVDTANRPWPTNVAPAAGLLLGRQRAARSPERWPAVPPRATRAQGGAAWSLPLQIGEMDAKTRNLALLAALSVALLHRHCLDDGSRCFRLGLFAFGVVGIFGAAERHWR